MRLKECDFELNPVKTKVAYCKESHQKKEYKTIQFDFLGYTFRPRRGKDLLGLVFLDFMPAICRSAEKAV